MKYEPFPYAGMVTGDQKDSAFYPMLFVALLVVILFFLLYECGYRRGAYAAKQQIIQEQKNAALKTKPVRLFPLQQAVSQKGGRVYIRAD